MDLNIDQDDMDCAVNYLWTTDAATETTPERFAVWDLVVATEDSYSWVLQLVAAYPACSPACFLAYSPACSLVGHNCFCYQENLHSSEPVPL